MKKGTNNSRRYIAVLLLSLIGIATVTGAPKSAGTVEWKYIASMSSTDQFAPIQVDLLDEINKKTEGRVKVTPYWNDTLVGMAQVIGGIGDHIADMGFMVGANNIGYIPFIDPISMPIMFDNVEKGMLQAREACVALKPYTDAALLKANCIDIGGGGFPSGVGSYVWSRVPINSLNDFKGLKIFCTGTQKKQFLEALGAVVVSMASTDAVPALQAKTIDAAVWGADSLDKADYAPYLFKLPISTSTLYLLANADSFKALSPDDQKAIIEAGTHFAEVRVKIKLDNEAKYFEAIKAKGVKIVVPTPEMLKTAQLLAEKIWLDYSKKYQKELPRLLDICLKATGKTLSTK